VTTVTHGGSLSSDPMGRGNAAHAAELYRNIRMMDLLKRIEERIKRETDQWGQIRLGTGDSLLSLLIEARDEIVALEKQEQESWRRH